jgi:hypothetical protein
MKLTRKRNGKVETVQAESPTLVTRLKSEGWKPAEEPKEKPADTATPTPSAATTGKTGGKA